MSARQYAGGAAASTLSAGIASGDATISVASASTWPASGAFSIVIDRGLAGEEKCLVASRSGNTLTITTRGYDGTSAAAHTSGATVECCATAIDFQEANDHIQATVAHGATGAVVGTTNSQVLTNKTLTDPTINAAGGTLVLPQGTVPAETAEGQVVWDTDDDLLTVGTASGRKTMQDLDSAQTVSGVKTHSAGIVLASTSFPITDTTGVSPTALTPTFTNLTLVTGTVTAGKHQYGRELNYALAFTFGAGDSITGNLQASLPGSAAAWSAGIMLTGYAEDVSAGQRYIVFGYATAVSDGTFDLVGIGTNGLLTPITSTFPFTWAAGDKLRFTGCYPVDQAF